MARKAGIEASDLSARYSDACKRSGLAALLAAAIAFTLAQRLAVVEPLNAFGSYLTAREILKLAVDELTASSFWPHMLANAPSGIDADDVTLGQLAAVECVRSSKGNHVRPVRSRSSPLEVSRNRVPSPVAAAIAQEPEQTRPMSPADVDVRAAPMPPADVLIESIESCPGLRDIYLALETLAFDPSIQTARRLSTEADLELYGWQVARNRVYEKAAARLPRSPDILRVGFDPRHAALALRDLRELNGHPHITQSQYTALANSLLIVATPYAAVNQGVNSASLLAHAALFVFVAYFALNLRAARASGALRAPGSLFALLGADNWGRAFLVLVMPLPAAAAVYLAVQMTGTERVIGILFAAGTSSLIALAGYALWREFDRANLQ